MLVLVIEDSPFILLHPRLIHLLAKAKKINNENYTPLQKSIEELLKSGNKLTIPRFQRAYSWEKYEVKDFFQDLIKNFKFDGQIIETSSYFVSTMLFIEKLGDPTITEIIVIDGQQRLTTITIFLSTLSKILNKTGNISLLEEVFLYIMNQERWYKIQSLV